MDNRLREISLELQKMTSSHAADWLMETYPADSPKCWEGFELISHISWKREDQIRLARHYLKNIPFASQKGYEVFASFMSFKLFVKIIREQLPITEDRIGLLLYYLLQTLEKAARTESDRELIKSLIAEIVPPNRSIEEYLFRDHLEPVRQESSGRSPE